MLRFFVVALLGCSSMPHSPPSSPAPKGALPELDYFVGRWAADARNPATGQTFAMDYTIEPMLGGRWYAGIGHAAALGLEIRDVWGKDPVSGEIVRTIFDSQQTFGTVRSPGWNGNVLVFTGEASSAQGRVTVRETIEKKTADEFHAVWEMKTGETWTAYSDETLRRKR